MSESKRPLRATGQPPQRLPHQAIRPPVIEWYSANPEIEIDSELVPDENRPFHPAAFAGQRSFRERGEQCIADALPTRFRDDEKILEVKAACGKKGGVVVKEKREANRLVSRVGRRTRSGFGQTESADGFLGGDTRVGKPLVLGGPFNEGKDQRVSCTVAAGLESRRRPRSRREYPSERRNVSMTLLFADH